MRKGVCLSTRSDKANMHDKGILVQRWVFNHEVINPKNVWKSKECSVWSKGKCIVDECNGC